MFKRLKLIVLATAILVFLFIFTRPIEYRNVARDFPGTLEDQWCAWVETVGHECDRWRHARRLIDEAKQIGETIESRLPATPPLEDANAKQD